MYLEFLLCMVILIYFTRNREGFNRPSQRSTDRLPENKPFRIRMEIIRQQQLAQKKREHFNRPSQRSTERLPENKPFRTSMEIKRQQQPVQKKREQLGILISKQKITL